MVCSSKRMGSTKYDRGGPQKSGAVRSEWMRDGRGAGAWTHTASDRRALSGRQRQWRRSEKISQGPAGKRALARVHGEGPCRSCQRQSPRKGPADVALLHVTSLASAASGRCVVDCLTLAHSKGSGRTKAIQVPVLCKGNCIGSACAGRLCACLLTLRLREPPYEHEGGGEGELRLHLPFAVCRVSCSGAACCV